MFGAIEMKARLAARRAAFSLAGALLLMVGLAFLTVAAWIGLVQATDTLTAALVIGGAYTGLALIAFAFAIRRPRVPMRDPYVAAAMATPPRHKSGLEEAGGIAAAFMSGLNAGSAARNGFHRGREH
ncbi:hypothetical protein [Maritimibacter sp. DP1N21-5]|uniref:hypothetical protein n=1 Tax=Maritimibacter sp. DP1N21-5 TaxID=2836867 RepID=UPI001C4653A4|nr:hypothetical protein [Maritimibacter sp. DP1N21-5]MBV7407777.1 hypothetical protein [Maritimibacter sp. DP1N21-5]